MENQMHGLSMWAFYCVGRSSQNLPKFLTDVQRQSSDMKSFSSSLQVEMSCHQHLGQGL